MKLVKHKVCTSCFSIGITDNDCICTYQRNYPIIELEFEQCECCGNVNDNYPPESEFNTLQLKKLEKSNVKS